MFPFLLLLKCMELKYWNSIIIWKQSWNSPYLLLSGTKPSPKVRNWKENSNWSAYFITNIRNAAKRQMFCMLCCTPQSFSSGHYPQKNPKHLVPVLKKWHNFFREISQNCSMFLGCFFFLIKFYSLDIAADNAQRVCCKKCWFTSKWLTAVLNSVP